MSDYHDIIGNVGLAIDVVGVFVIVAGVLFASGRLLLRTQTAAARRFQDFRHDLARAILLGLEFLIAGDIIRTVAVTPTLSSVSLLGLIVLIRTFLSITLHLEVEGRWPWQKVDQPDDRTAPAPHA